MMRKPPRGCMQTDALGRILRARQAAGRSWLALGGETFCCTRCCSHRQQLRGLLAECTAPTCVPMWADYEHSIGATSCKVVPLHDLEVETSAIRLRSVKPSRRASIVRALGSADEYRRVRLRTMSFRERCAEGNRRYRRQFRVNSTCRSPD